VTEIRVPKLSNNDTEYVLLAWLGEEGKPVEVGDPIAEVETSKAIEELVSTEAGYLGQLIPVGTTVEPGQVIGSVTPTPHASGAQQEPDAVSGSGPLITAPARALMDELGITDGQVATLGVSVVRRGDIEGLHDTLRETLGESPSESLSEAGPAHATVAISRVQQAVGRAVSESHDTIPAAYTAVKMDIGGLLTRAAETTKEIRRPVGLAELFVAAVARLHGSHPLFFAALDGTQARLADAPHIGVTLDLGNGLYVPVVHDAAQASLKEIATQLTAYRVAALEGTFHGEDLNGANIAVTLHTEADVCLAIPFVFPGHVCALAVTAPQTELVLDPDGAVTARTVAAIGLAYDHRLINGREAALFLGALREELS